MGSKLILFNEQVQAFHSIAHIKDMVFISMENIILAINAGLPNFLEGNNKEILLWLRLELTQLINT